ncbi:MAG TPA: sigma-70 family RNA polymerase sigma factor [Verrucomicrobiae bacterium]|nr:sigma-70 family RNA polymerase sigma factor [Verrucomicrobiae bacterium]
MLTAGDTQSPDSVRALESLCRAYWYPLYGYIRWRGHGAHEAEDLTQAFFAYLLEKKALGKVDPAKGKFRSFLLASLNNFLNNEWDKAQRLKRGGGAEIFSFDGVPAEERFLLEPTHGQSPERLFERRWAETVLKQVVANLAEEFRKAGQSERFEALRGFLMAGAREAPYEEVAARLGMTVTAVTAAVRRMRLRFRELFRAEIAHTVQKPEEVDDEIRYLLGALSE